MSLLILIELLKALIDISGNGTFYIEQEDSNNCDDVLEESSEEEEDMEITDTGSDFVF